MTGNLKSDAFSSIAQYTHIITFKSQSPSQQYCMCSVERIACCCKYPFFVVVIFYVLFYFEKPRVCVTLFLFESYIYV
jgi:hypothetical protein